MGAPPPAPLPPGGYTSARHDSQTSLQSSQNSPLPQSKDRPPSQISNMGAPPPPSMTPNMAGMTMSNNAPPPPSMTQDSTSRSRPHHTGMALSNLFSFFDKSNSHCELCKCGNANGKLESYLKTSLVTS